MKTAVIYSNGEYPSRMFAYNLAAGADLIIAADGGGNIFEAMPVRPDFLIGDFDSVQEKLLKRFEEEGVKILRYPVEKDQTDLQLAVQQAIDSGAEKIILTGSMGGRIDQSFASLYLLNDLNQRGIQAEIREPGSTVRLIDSRNEKEVILKDQKGKRCSILAFSDEADGVSLSGFKYPLDHAKLDKRDPGRAISNEITEDEAVIRFDDGILFLEVAENNR